MTYILSCKMQAAFHAATVVGLLLFYHPKRATDFPKMSFAKIVWACDPIGSLLFIFSASLLLLSLDWAGGAFPWSNTHVAVPLSIGLVLMVLFCLYEWKASSCTAKYQTCFDILFRGERMDSSPTYFSPATITSHCPFLPLRWKGRSI